MQADRLIVPSSFKTPRGGRPPLACITNRLTPQTRLRLRSDFVNTEHSPNPTVARLPAGAQLSTVLQQRLSAGAPSPLIRAMTSASNAVPDSIAARKFRLADTLAHHTVPASSARSSSNGSDGAPVTPRLHVSSQGTWQQPKGLSWSSSNADSTTDPPSSCKHRSINSS